MLRKTLCILILISMLGLATASVASAQTPGNGSSWITGFFVTNKSSNQASVVMEFYRENNGTAAHTVNRTVSANDTVFYFLGTGGDLENDVSTGEYSLVLSSGEPINAVANSTSSGVGGAASETNSTTSFDGVSGTDAADTLYAPNIYANFFGFQTNFYVQNAGDADTTVNITIFDSAGAAIPSLTETGVSIPKGSFIKRDQAGTAITQNTVGSAQITCTTANCKLAGVVNIVHTADSIGTANYVMFTSGSTVAYAPVVLNDYFQFTSSINVQNNGTGTISYDIDFSDGTKVSHTNIGPGQATSDYLPNVTGLASGDTNGDLAATVTILNPQAGNSIVVLANTDQKNASLQPDTAFQAFASYNGVTSGAATVYSPASNAKAFGSLSFFTSITCQNLSSTATDLRYTFNGVETNNSNAAVNGVSGLMSDITGAPATLAQGASYVLLLNVDQTLTDLGLSTSGGFNGATTIEAVASGAQISCVVNQNRTTPGLAGDNLGAYTSRP